MAPQSFAQELMQSAVGGVSKTQVIRTFKERYDCSDDQMRQLINLCSFKSPPKQIDYKKFYNAKITSNGKRIFYPFTQLYVCNDFLTNNECQTLIELIDQNLRPSTVADESDSASVSDYRTSQTADLHYFNNDTYLNLDRKIVDITGLDCFTGEMLQCQKYNPGQYYKEHWDFFSPLTKEYKVYCEWMGQRTWTTMVYLNDVESGGETYFKYLNLHIKPKQGTLIAWNNLYKNGIPNFKTMHEALPPISGDKYVITKWFRSWSLI